MGLRASLGVCALLAWALAVEAVGGPREIRPFRPTLPRKFNVYDDPGGEQRGGRGSAAVAQLAAGGASWPPSLARRVQAAASHLQNERGIPAATIRITDAYADDASGIAHIYAQQVVEGLEVANGLANVNVDGAGRVISSSETFAAQDLFAGGEFERLAQAARAEDTNSLRAALLLLAATVAPNVDGQAAVAALQITPVADAQTGATRYTISGLPAAVASASGSCTATQQLIQTSAGQIARVWHVLLQQPGHWWSAHVNPDLGQVEALNDWAYALEGDPSYRVLPPTVASPDDGERRVVRRPASSSAASPAGWVSAGTTTTGNNVWAQTNPSGGDAWKANYRPHARATPDGPSFDFAFDKAREPAGYADYSVAQLFYTVNVMHDLSFVYGFNEAAGNFQDVNFSGLGKGGDYIVAFAQDGSAENNASFMSPPDGQNGVMRMFLWNQTVPSRDAALEQDVVAHEFTHGISNRLTGGPANADCLAGGDAGGMGEGWSDSVANILRVRPNDTRTRDMEMGAYVRGRGLRTYPYSTSLATNPHTYGFLDRAGYQEVHKIGEVWASLLYEVLWSLVDASAGRISADLFDRDLRTGNALALQLLLDGMKLQPCNPTFVNARDAILQAERILAAGRHRCALWRGFAKRGLGTRASAEGGRHVESFDVPSDCSA
ncbi:hypothetical protein H4R18_004314 [Coemansia javaensis]|uniref:Extracellular metalloproteinase n=1 Tax=Coemansia javaensis TaxID=2761396 RepID=A0A9W8H584_9FUNG|nr:hypothetical protein H4R18_004314 [Coemansia javaensis]